MKKLIFSVYYLTSLISSTSSFLPTVAPSTSSDEKSLGVPIDFLSSQNDQIVYPLILNRIALNTSRSEHILDQSSTDSERLRYLERDLLNEGSFKSSPRPKKRKKYLKKIVVRRRPGRKVVDGQGMYNQENEFDRGAIEDQVRKYATTTRETTASPTASKTPKPSLQAFQSKTTSKSYLNEFEVVNLKNRPTKTSTQKYNVNSNDNIKRISFQSRNGRPNRLDQKGSPQITNFFGDKLFHKKPKKEEQTSFTNNVGNEDYNDFVSNADENRIKHLRETYFSTTEQSPELSDVNVNALGYTIVPKPTNKQRVTRPTKRVKYSNTRSRVNDITPSTKKEPSFKTTLEKSNKELPPVDRSNLPKAFQYVSDKYLRNLTTQDILFGDPLTHTHPLGTHPLLPVHEGYNVPHSHPPYTDEPVVHLLPKLSNLIKSFLFPETGIHNKEKKEGPFTNPKRHTAPPQPDISDNGTTSYQRNESHFSHRVNIPGHHQYHSQKFPGKKFKKILVKARILENPSSGQSKNTTPNPLLHSTSPYLTEPSSENQLLYSPTIPGEFISYLEPRTGTSSKIDYAKRKRSFTSSTISSSLSTS